MLAGILSSSSSSSNSKSVGAEDKNDDEDEFGFALDPNHNPVSVCQRKVRITIKGLCKNNYRTGGVIPTKRPSP